MQNKLNESEEMIEITREHNLPVSTVWEGNTALTLENMELPRMTPRSKYIAVKPHWIQS